MISQILQHTHGHVSIYICIYMSVYTCLCIYAISYLTCYARFCSSTSLRDSSSYSVFSCIYVSTHRIQHFQTSCEDFRCQNFQLCVLCYTSGRILNTPLTPLLLPAKPHIRYLCLSNLPTVAYRSCHVYVGAKHLFIKYHLGRLRVHGDARYRTTE